jgi:hypothetical protein
LYLAWIVKCRRLDHDYERLIEAREAMIERAMIAYWPADASQHPGGRPDKKTSTTP